MYCKTILHILQNLLARSSREWFGNSGRAYNILFIRAQLSSGNAVAETSLFFQSLFLFSGQEPCTHVIAIPRANGVRDRWKNFSLSPPRQWRFAKYPNVCVRGCTFCYVLAPDCGVHSISVKTMKTRSRKLLMPFVCFSFRNFSRWTFFTSLWLDVSACGVCGSDINSHDKSVDSIGGKKTNFDIERENP